MTTNTITNAVVKACQICGLEDSLLHGFKHLTLQEYFWATLIVVFVVFVLVLIFKCGVPVIIETWFGKIKIPSIRKKTNTVNACELCRINVTSLVTSIAELCHKIYKLEQRNVNEQMRELDSQFFLENSWINNCHGEMIREKIKLITNLDETETTKIIMKNEQILYFIWLIKRQEIYEFVKNIILLNNFCEKNPIELRYFVEEKTEVLAAKISGGTNLYPDWDDKELLFKRQEYCDILMKRIEPRLEETMHYILEKCQNIQQKFNTALKDAENEKIKIVNEFKKSLPPKDIGDNGG